MEKRKVFSSLSRNELKNFKNNPLLNALAESPFTPYVVSNFINFSFETNFLQDCSAKLETALERRRPACNVVIDTIKGLEFSPPGLSVNISNNGKVLYESIFLSLSDQQNDNNSIRLPLLCVIKDGGSSFLKIIHLSLEKMFGCNIRSCSVTNNKFLWLIGIGIHETIMRKENVGISMSFCIPNFCEKAHIQVQLTEESLENLWLASRSDPKSNILKLTEIEEFYHGLLLHINNTYGCSLEECIIKNVNMEEVKFYTGVKITISSAEVVYLMLSFIQSDCIDHLC